eukprot:1161902-Pelagomonas_calceolata.AAC.3
MGAELCMCSFLLSALTYRAELCSSRTPPKKISFARTHQQRSPKLVILHNRARAFLTTHGPLAVEMSIIATAHLQNKYLFFLHAVTAQGKKSILMREAAAAAAKAEAEARAKAEAEAQEAAQAMADAAAAKAAAKKRNLLLGDSKGSTGSCVVQGDWAKAEAEARESDALLKAKADAVAAQVRAEAGSRAVEERQTVPAAHGPVRLLLNRSLSPCKTFMDTVGARSALLCKAFLDTVVVMDTVV